VISQVRLRPPTCPPRLQTKGLASGVVVGVFLELVDVEDQGWFFQ